MLSVPSIQAKPAGSGELPRDLLKVPPRPASLASLRSSLRPDSPQSHLATILQVQHPEPQASQRQEQPPSEPKQCPKCKADGRNLVVCIDGTSNKFGTNNTNVIALYHQLRKFDQQLTYYSSGVGTYARPSWRSPSYWRQLVSNRIDLAIAWNLEAVIIGAYRWLADNYREGDKIFLFGFSRGAYQARALAAMIEKVGLLLPGNTEQIPFAFELYASLDGIGNLTSNEQRTKATIFKETFCRRGVSVHFVGAWDTVSSVGFQGKTLPFTRSSTHICAFRHALALDERRVKFLPEYVNTRGNSLDGSDRESTDVKEVWFPGSHSDVGGGSRPNHDLQQAGMSLQWMKKEAGSAGLLFESSAEQSPAWLKDFKAPLTKSLNLCWWPLEFFPLRQLAYDAITGTKHTRAWHLGRPRFILPEQKIHVSALFRDGYAPRARFQGSWSSWPEQFYWADSTGEQRLKELPGSNWEEKDLFHPTVVRALLDELLQVETSETEHVQELVELLAFMANFKTENQHVNNDHKNKLLELLDHEHFPVKLCTAIAICELNLRYQPPDNDVEKAGNIVPFREFFSDVHILFRLKNVAQSAIEALNSTHSDHHIQACVALHPFCRRKELKEYLLNVETFGTLLASAYLHRSRDARDHSVQALSLLLQTDIPAALSWMEDRFDDNGRLEAGKFDNVVKFLDSDNQRVVVAVIRLLIACTASTENQAPKGSSGARLYSLLKMNDVFHKVTKLIGRYTNNPYVLTNVVDWASITAPYDADHRLIGAGVILSLSTALEECLVEERDFVEKSFLKILKNDEFARELVQNDLMIRLFRKLLSSSGFQAVTEVIIKLTEIHLVREAVEDACKYIVQLISGQREGLMESLHTQVLRALSLHAHVQLVYALSRLLHSSSLSVTSIKEIILHSHGDLPVRIQAMLSNGVLMPRSKTMKRLHLDGIKIVKDLLSANDDLRRKIITGNVIGTAVAALGCGNAHKELVGAVNLVVAAQYADLHDTIIAEISNQVNHIISKALGGDQAQLDALVAIHDMSVELELLTPIHDTIARALVESAKDITLDPDKLPNETRVNLMAKILARFVHRDEGQEITRKLVDGLRRNINTAVKKKSITATEGKTLGRAVTDLKIKVERACHVSRRSLPDRVRELIPLPERKTVKGGKSLQRRNSDPSFLLNGNARKEEAEEVPFARGLRKVRSRTAL